MFKIKNKIEFSPNENKMKSVADVSAAIKIFNDK